MTQLSVVQLSRQSSMASHRIERMRLVRDDIAARVRALAAELGIADAGFESAAR